VTAFQIAEETGIGSAALCNYFSEVEVSLVDGRTWADVRSGRGGCHPEV